MRSFKRSHVVGLPCSENISLQNLTSKSNELTSTQDANVAIARIFLEPDAVGSM